MKKLVILLFVLAAIPTLAQEYDKVFVFLNKNPDKENLSEEEETELINQHLENMRILASEGKLINAGPFEGGGGIFVLNTPSVETARKWIQTDPAIQANRWILELFVFKTSAGGSCSVEPPYEMVTYQFARYTPSNQIANYKSNAVSEAENAYQELIAQLKKSEQLIMAGHFGNNEGGIFVVRDMDGMNSIKSSALIGTGYYEFDYKELWIAKGSFCEK